MIALNKIILPEIKEWLKKKSEDRAIVVWAATAAGLFCAMLLILWPLAARYHKASATLALRARQIASAKNGVSSIAPEELARVQKRLLAFRRGFITESQVPSLVKAVSERARESKIHLIGIRSEYAVKEDAGHERCPVMADFEGDVKSLAEFLMNLTRHLPAVFAVDSLRLKKTSPDSSVLTGEMKMGFFSGESVSKKPETVTKEAKDKLPDLSFVGAVRESEKRFERQESVWDREWGRDPFMPQAPGAPASGTLQVEGIVWDAKMPMAMINEKVMKVGDSVGEYKIIRIESNVVVFSSDEGGEFEIPLKTE